MGLEQAEQALEAARREHERLAQQREQVKASIRRIGQVYHFVDLDCGVRRNGSLIAADIQQQLNRIRAIAEQEGLSQPRLEQIGKAEQRHPQNASHHRVCLGICSATS